MATPIPSLTPRHFTLDLLRGVAVMGILLLNIVGFAMPDAAYINPMAWGGSIADQGVWTATFILFDGKMRGLFALLFGASMLLAMEQAAMAGNDPAKVHKRRMAWLFAFGLAHFLLLWWGDVLMIYAVAGLFALPFAGAEPADQVKVAFLAFLVQFAIAAGTIIWAATVQAAALAPGAGPDALADHAAVLAMAGAPGNPTIAADLALHAGSFGTLFADRLAQLVATVPANLLFAGFESFGFMLLGMAMLKMDVLTGGWDRERYLSTARHCLVIGLVPMAALAAWLFHAGFAPLATFGAFLAWSLPFRIPLVVGIATLILALPAAAEGGRIAARIAAAGRMTLTNYLATSLILSLLFNGYGLGLYGRIDRPLLYPIVAGAWLLMLLWSKPWLAAFRFGPAEWLWRSLVAGCALPMRRTPAP